MSVCHFLLSDVLSNQNVYLGEGKGASLVSWMSRVLSCHKMYYCYATCCCNDVAKSQAAGLFHRLKESLSPSEISLQNQDLGCFWRCRGQKSWLSLLKGWFHGLVIVQAVTLAHLMLMFMETIKSELMTFAGNFPVKIWRSVAKTLW